MHSLKVHRELLSLLPFFQMLSCQNSIIDLDSFSMLQTDTLQFTQIAQTIDKLVFHLAGEKKLIQLRKKHKIQFKRSERGKNMIFCRFFHPVFECKFSFFVDFNWKNFAVRQRQGAFSIKNFIIKLISQWKFTTVKWKLRNQQHKSLSQHRKHSR